MCQRSGLPATGFNTLPGRRVEPMRAWITATILGRVTRLRLCRQDGYFSSTETVQSLYSSFTNGSIIFQSAAALAQNNANFFWDNTNFRLGIGTNAPTSALQIVGSAAGAVGANITNSSTSTSASLGYNLTNQNGATGALTLFANNFVAPYLSNVTRLSGSNGLWLASDVNNASGGTDNIVFSVGGYNNITAQVTTNGVTAINLTDTGIAASNAGAPLSINSSQVIVPGITNSEASSTTTITTTSTTDVLMTGMTLTPAAGTYLVMFSSWFTHNSAGDTITVSIYNAATQKADSVRTITPFQSGGFGAAQNLALSTQGVVTVNGSQAITIQWHTNGGTATANQRTMNIVRLA